LLLSFDFALELEDGLGSEVVDVSFRDTVLEDLALKVWEIREIK
jgi:hypothetical protein